MDSGTIWVGTWDDTTFSGDGAGNNFDTNINADSLDQLKVKLRKGNDLFKIFNEVEINGKATVSLGGGNDYFHLDGRGTSLFDFGTSHSTFLVKSGGGEDSFIIALWTFNGETKIRTGVGDDSGSIASDYNVIMNGRIKVDLGGGDDSLSADVTGFEGSAIDTLTLSGGGGDDDELYTGHTETEVEALGIDVVGFEKFS